MSRNVHIQSVLPYFIASRSIRGGSNFSAHQISSGECPTHYNGSHYDASLQPHSYHVPLLRLKSCDVRTNCNSFRTRHTARMPNSKCLFTVLGALLPGSSNSLIRLLLPRLQMSTNLLLGSVHKSLLMESVSNTQKETSKILCK